MAPSKKTGGLILAILAWAMAGAAAQFPMRHRHLRGGCEGTLEVSESGVRFAGPKSHGWQWKLGQIRQLKLAPDRIVVTTYENGRLPGTERSYEFSGAVPAAELYALLKDRMDQRLIAETTQPPPAGYWPNSKPSPAASCSSPTAYSRWMATSRPCPRWSRRRAVTAPS